MKTLVSLLGAFYVISTITGVAYALLNQNQEYTDGSEEKHLENIFDMKLYNYPDLSKGNNTYQIDIETLVFQFETCFFYKIEARQQDDQFVEKYLFKEDSILNHIRIEKTANYSIKCNKNSKKPSSKIGKDYSQPDWIPSNPDFWQSDEKFRKSQKPEYIPYQESKSQHSKSRTNTLDFF